MLQIAILTPSSRPTFHLFNLVSLQRVKHHYTFRFRPRKVYQYGTRPNSKPFYSKPSIIWRLCKGPMFSNTDCYFDFILKSYSSFFHFGQSPASKTCLNISFKAEENLPLQAKTKFPAFLEPNMPNFDPLQNPHVMCYRLLF